MYTLLAHAKINLTLDVLARRADGYHELRSVMQTVSLADDLTVERAPDLTLEVEPRSLAGPRNLVWLAAQELRLRSGYAGGALLRLRKRVPVAAGLGGGSSDAAAALTGLNALWDLTWPRDRLSDVAATIGSDVPFFLWGGTALITGRGEFVHPLSDWPSFSLVLAKPPISISTAQVFAALKPEHYTDGAASASLIAAASRIHPSTWPLHNALQATVCHLYPQVEATLMALQATGASRVLMSGSGPTCFGLYPTTEEAAAATTRLVAQGWQAWTVTTVGRHDQVPAHDVAGGASAG